MGKGDKKTKRGKIIRGTYGVTRPHKQKKTSVIVKTEIKEKVSKENKTDAKPKAKRETTKKTTEKKTATKKTETKKTSTGEKD
ncbi:MAG TPA: 30S ribosomal protein THX [Bacteroidales bacterium]|nr:30S ribosomal protein THX [Bacteroidales bacterium]